MGRYRQADRLARIPGLYEDAAAPRQGGQIRALVRGRRAQLARRTRIAATNCRRGRFSPISLWPLPGSSQTSVIRQHGVLRDELLADRSVRGRAADDGPFLI